MSISCAEPSHSTVFCLLDFVADVNSILAIMIDKRSHDFNKTLYWIMTAKLFLPNKSQGSFWVFYQIQLLKADSKKKYKVSMRYQKMDTMEQFALKKKINLSKNSQNELKNFNKEKHILIFTQKSFKVCSSFWNQIRIRFP